jgi:uncharacterized protein (DUF1015 family)
VAARRAGPTLTVSRTQRKRELRQANTDRVAMLTHLTGLSPEVINGRSTRTPGSLDHRGDRPRPRRGSRTAGSTGPLDRPARSVELDRVTRTVRDGAPLLDASLPDGGTVRLWPVTDPLRSAELAVAARSVGMPTIADGHHRAAAVARRVGTAAKRAPAPSTRSEPRPEAGRVLTALVSADELAVEPFHRRIDGLGDVTATEVAAVLAERGLRLQALPGPGIPERRGIVHLVVAGSWWRIEIGDRGRPLPGGSLDAAIVEHEVLAPLGTLAPGPAPAPIVPVPGPVGLDALDRPGAVGVALLPVTLTELLAVTGAGHVLPQKSTYVLPKLRSGVLLVPR